MQQLSLFVAVLATLAATASAAAPVELTALELEEDFLPTDYVYNPSGNETSTFPGGTSSTRGLLQFPALAKSGISQTLFSLDPCSMRQPHAHQRASGLLYLIQGDNLQVGFATETGGPTIVNNITTGASAYFPQGLIHYQLNLACTQAIYTISYSNEDPGTQETLTGLFNLPANAVAIALGLTPQEVTVLKAGRPTANLIGASAACLALCGLPAAPAGSISIQSTG